MIKIIIIFLVIQCGFCCSNFANEISDEDNAYTALPNCEIMAVAQSRNINKIRDMIENGADINCQNKFGYTALMVAAMYNSDVVPVFLDYGADTDISNQSGWTALMHAVQNSNLKSIQYLVQAGADLEKKESGLGRTALTIACTPPNKNQDIVKLLLEAGADVKSKDLYGQTALMCNIEMHQGRDIDVLVEYGADINAYDKYGRSVLMFASNSASPDVLRKLLTYNPNINWQNENGQTALFYAVSNKKVEIIDILIEAGADIDVVDKEGRDLLLYSSLMNKTEAVRKFIELGFDINSTDNTGKTFYSLMSSFGYSANEYKKMFDEFDKLGGNINTQDESGKTALMYSIINLNYEAFELLLNFGANTSIEDNFGHTFIDYLKEVHDTEVLDKMVKIAKEKNIISKDQLTELYAKRQQIEQFNTESIVISEEYTDTQIQPISFDIKQILAKTSDINAQNSEGKTLLMEMCKMGCDVNTVKAIIQAGIDINVKDNEGQTALMFAAQNCSLKVVEFLINSGADLYSVREDNKNALMYAAQNQNSDVIDLLINKFDVNAKMDNDWTALMFASRDGCPEVVRSLIEYGADAKAVTVGDMDAIIGAIKQENIDIMKILIDEGVDVTTKRSSRYGYPLEYSTRWASDPNTILFLVDEISKTEDPNKHIINALKSALRNQDSFSISEEIIDLLHGLSKQNNSKTIMSQELTDSLISQIYYEKLDFVKKLISMGADPNGVNENGETVLMSAVGNEDIEIIKLILIYDVNIDAVHPTYKYTALHKAIKSNLKVAKILIEAGADIYNQEIYGDLVSVAAGSGNTKALELLCEYNLYTSEDEGQALVEAAKHNKLPLVKELLAKGISNEYISEALVVSGSSDRIDDDTEEIKLKIIEELLSNGADINAIGKIVPDTLLMKLCISSYPQEKLIKFCIENGADINFINSRNRNALQYAIFENNTKAIDILIDAGVVINEKDMKYAFDQKRYELLPLLISTVGKIDNSYSFDLLSKTLWAPNKDVLIEMLLDAGADINGNNNFWKLTPLMYYCENAKNEESIQLLIDYGADVTIKEKRGHDAKYFLQRNRKLKNSSILD